MKTNYSILAMLFFSIFSFGQTPTIVWSYSMPEKVDRTSPAIADDGTVYIACDYTVRNVLGAGNTEPNFFAINPNNTLKWQASITEGASFDKVDQIQSSPSINSDGSIFMGGHYGRRIYKFNATDGTFITRDLGSRIRYTAPAYSSTGDVYISTRNNGNKGFRNVSPDLATENWIAASTIDFNSTPAVGADGTIFAVSTNGSVYAFNPDGTEKWNAVYGVGGYASSAIALGSNGTVYVSAKQNAAGDGVLIAYNPSTGAENWSVTFTGENSEQGGPAVAADGTIYLGTAGGIMRAFNPTTGAVNWTFTASAGIEVVPAIDNAGKIYFGSTDGMFYVLNPDGTQAYTPIDLGDKINSSAAIGTDGRIYVASTTGTGAGSGKLYALTTSATGLQTGGWAMYGKNAKHTSNVNPITLSTSSFEMDDLQIVNPVIDKTLEIFNELNTLIEVEIFDLQGKSLLKKSVIDNSVDVSSLQSGFYLAKFYQEGKSSTRKIIIK